MSNLDKKINALKPGGSFRIADNSKVWTTVERSGDGLTLRFVRHTPTTQTVFKTMKF